MTDRSADIWLAGVDGCPEGWIAALIRPSGGDVEICVVRQFADLLAKPLTVIAVDMPIGLPDNSPPKGRTAEMIVRTFLGQRKSSVFRIPSRGAVYASVANEPADDRERFFAACKIARESSEDRKAFAKQAFYILHKVVEIDTLLRTTPEARRKIYETHPEVAYWQLNGGRPLTEPKKVKSRPYEPGLALRRRLLIEAGLIEKAVHQPPPKGAGTDDLLDAMACAVVARRLHRGEAMPYPNPPPRDAFGLPMAIWA